ncbi:acyltransferase family protein [Paraglaciecola chathamensis]|uniref:Acyltransferase 3 n=1 Tax=Paraglaciecola chathamensis S18K6 TaxID=1127672 RepID=A0AAV3V6Q9_9ALTE|nr:acyltransferase [Paraglaciecola chathamensis]GAC12392.1 acyltransferase 3 [Paraglaciecola chathamensis S18K6]
MSDPKLYVMSHQKYLDLAKGIGICLVVTYHTCEGILNSFQFGAEAIQALTNFFRSWLMPMFFMVSGILIRNSICNKPIQKHRSKLLDWVYIYFVWSIIIYLVRLFSNSFTNTNMAADEILLILWDPVPTIWFIYALALSHFVTLLIKNVPPSLVISVALAANLLNSYYFGWFSGSIFERFAWVYLFYAIGFFKGNWLIEMIKNEKLATWGPLFFVGFGVFIALFRSELPWVTKPIVSLFMAISFLIICYRAELVFKNTMLFKFSVYIGSISLFIYLTHFALPAATRMLLSKIGLYSFSANILIAVGLAVCIGIIASKLYTKQPIKLFFERPKCRKEVKNVTPYSV